MNLQERKLLLVRLGQYIKEDTEEWKAVKHRAFSENNWFVPDFTTLASETIAEQYLQPTALDDLMSRYKIPDVQSPPKVVGLVMAGNIPLVGFHDLLCIFLTGHKAFVKTSSKDSVMIRHLVTKLADWNIEVHDLISFSDLLKNCDAYIATGSDNTATHFEYYFRKYPHLIRQNRTSVAVLTGGEPAAELEKLADDIHLYFGLGCRNVTKIFVPNDYDFLPLLEASRKYGWMINHHKYKNNYDYALAAQIINNAYYLTNDVLLLAENTSLFSPIAQLYYEFYDDPITVEQSLIDNNKVQCIIGYGQTPFGQAQVPAVCDYADGVDTMQFLLAL